MRKLLPYVAACMALFAIPGERAAPSEKLNVSFRPESIFYVTHIGQLNYPPVRHYPMPDFAADARKFGTFRQSLDTLPQWVKERINSFGGRFVVYDGKVIKDNIEVQSLMRQIEVTPLIERFVSEEHDAYVGDLKTAFINLRHEYGLPSKKELHEAGHMIDDIGKRLSSSNDFAAACMEDNPDFTGIFICGQGEQMFADAFALYNDPPENRSLLSSMSKNIYRYFKNLDENKGK